QGAFVSSEAQDRTTYFIGDNVGDTLNPLPQTGTQAGGAVNAPTDTLSSSAGSEASDLTGCTRLTFTTLAPSIPLRLRVDENDFETQQERNGPQGGVAEVQWSTEAVGDAGDRQGLFERIQQPSDGDPSQGGTEALLTEDVRNIAFEFWNGADWTETWNTTGIGGRRLPAAVQVSYELASDDPGFVRRFVVPIPNSDVTALNPVADAIAGGGL
ncbi:MAG: type II secretion system protein GspJ, partial [Capsulimonadales bacterium]|nr:type II secretion system protein GspJ [Capsulimonadales bacterium]